MKFINYILLMLFFIGSLVGSVNADENDPIVVIVHPSNNLTDISLSELQFIYQGNKRRWPDGQKIMVLNWAVDNDIREKFYKVILNSPSDRKFFQSGSPTPFKTSIKKSSSSIRRNIARVQNAIGFIQLSSVTDKVKVLSIDMVDPSEEGYILE